MNSWEKLQAIQEEQRPLREIAKTEIRRLKVHPTHPVESNCRQNATNMYSPKMKAAVWGKTDNATISMLKLDVFDRRIIARKPVTADEITEGAYAEANKDFDDIPHLGRTRPCHGALVKEGGRRNYTAWAKMYPFPCQKPVGQVIFLPEDGGKSEPLQAEQSYSSGEITLRSQNGDFSMACLMGMKRNIVAVRPDCIRTPKNLRVRLYRHQDQSHLKYMNPDGTYIAKEKRWLSYQPADPSVEPKYYDLEGDAQLNAPFEQPKCGTDGTFFWVTQRFPAEDTFPQGFEYVLMGLVSRAPSQKETRGMQKGLGHKLDLGYEKDRYSDEGLLYSYFNNAEGVAADAVISGDSLKDAVVYLTVVTNNDSAVPLETAKQQLLEASQLGFDGIVQENTQWLDALYEKREKGRFFVKCLPEEQKLLDEITIEDAFTSWQIPDAGYCDPDPNRFEASEGYAFYDVDAQPWHSLPCYNEVFSEPDFVRGRQERYAYYYRLIKMWRKAMQQKARDFYNLPGLIFPHGYLPPIKPNPWYIQNQTLDLCLDVPGQILKCIWNVWDYMADEKALQEDIYPEMKDLAVFYDAFARKHYDGKYYNLEPVVETEAWGISYRLRYNRNTTGAIAMFRMILNLTAQAADKLGVDADLAARWRETAANLPPYPTFEISSGKILGGNEAEMPRWVDGDHPWFTGDYPALLGDEINLDSSQEEKDLIARTDDTIRTDVYNRYAYILVGKFKNQIPCDLHHSSQKIEGTEMLARDLNKYPERMLNSRSGRIHLFPVMPDFADVTIRDFRTRGGFEISACRENQQVTALVIRANQNTRCDLVNPWEGASKEEITVTDLTGKREVPFDFREGSILFPTETGHLYSIDCVKQN